MIKKRIYLILFVLIFVACSSDNNQEDITNATSESSNQQQTQLNISILLDLSDRVIQSMQPPQNDRDIEIVNSIIGIFKSNMTAKGTYQSKDKIQVLFDPTPKDPNINNIATKLKVDLSKLDNKGKKNVYDNIETQFVDGLDEIYKLTMKAGKETGDWPGSDIWRFFKYSANELCVESDIKYRNILVIITDGYVYHNQSLDHQKNRTAYVTPKYLQDEGFRNNQNWENKFESQDYGLIHTGQTFENLEIMVLEVNSSSKHKNDEDIIRAFIGKWFEEMKVNNFVIYNTDLPENTKKRIENFFKK